MAKGTAGTILLVLVAGVLWVAANVAPQHDQHPHVDYVQVDYPHDPTPPAAAPYKPAAPGSVTSTPATAAQSTGHGSHAHVMNLPHAGIPGVNVRHQVLRAIRH